MSSWTVVRLSEIPERGDSGWVPVRDTLGVRAFGINASRRAGVGEEVVQQHTERVSGHEELYVVLGGRATFTIAGEAVDAPAGTLVVVSDPELERRAVAAEPGTEVLAVGATPGKAFRVQPWETAWEEAQEALGLYRAERYAEAAAVLRRGLAGHPDHPTLHYNLACFACLADEPVDAVVHHLRRAIELEPSLADAAAGDRDLARIRGTAEYASAVAGQPGPAGAGA